jgi:hypothetical protein
VLDLIRLLSARRDLSRVSVEKSDFRLELRRTPPATAARRP